MKREEIKTYDQWEQALNGMLAKVKERHRGLLPGAVKITEHDLVADPEPFLDAHCKMIRAYWGKFPAEPYIIRVRLYVQKALQLPPRPVAPLACDQSLGAPPEADYCPE